MGVAVLIAQLDTLKSARRSSVLKTRFGDRAVTYKSDAEMVAAIAATEAEIAVAQGTPRATTVQIRSNKGW
jgi:hypothetical protein